MAHAYIRHGNEMFFFLLSTVADPIESSVLLRPELQQNPNLISISSFLCDSLPISFTPPEFMLPPSFGNIASTVVSHSAVSSTPRFSSGTVCFTTSQPQSTTQTTNAVSPLMMTQLGGASNPKIIEVSSVIDYSAKVTS